MRSKATEELLAAAPLTKTILFSPESTLPRDSVLNKGVGEGTGQLKNLYSLASEYSEAYKLALTAM